jgi:hypothetical protein
VPRRVVKVFATEVKRRHPVAVAGEAKVVATESDTYFQDVLVSELVERCDRIEPRGVLDEAKGTRCSIEF